MAEEAPQAEQNFIVEKVQEVSALKKQYSPEQVKFVKGLINPELTDNELFLFMSLANTLQLNPMNGEIIPVVYNGRGGRKINTITTRNGKRVIATRTGQLDEIVTNPIYIKQIPVVRDGAKPTDKPEFETKKCEPWEGGALWGAESTVIRKGKAFKAIVPFKEYDTGEYLWKSKPETMIKKVAESQALTMAFPEILGGIYDEVEVTETPADRENTMANTIDAALKERKMAKLAGVDPIGEEDDVQPPAESPNEPQNIPDKTASEDLPGRKLTLEEAIDKANKYAKGEGKNETEAEPGPSV